MSYFDILLGLVVLIVGGDVLVQGAAGIAKKLKLSPLVIGMTVVAFGTSSPEFMVSLKAAYMGSPEIALGNVVGSNIANIALVLGITVLILPMAVDRNSKNIDWPVMMASSLVFVFVALDGEISRFEGVTLFLSLVVFISLMIRNSRKKNKKAVVEEQGESPNIYLSIGKNIVGLVMLYFGSKWLVSGAIDVANNFNIDKRVIGITVIAFGTSVPELATSVMAAIRKQTDISIGNLVGSNIFNILCVIGLTATVQPIAVDSKIINPDAYWMLAIAFALGLMMFFWKKINRFHGVLLVVSYLVYIGILVMSQKG
jgi:cation:H+ antiporter